MLAATAVAALVLSATALAGGNTYKLRITPAGTAAARALLLTKADVGTDWTGGPSKPSTFNPSVCKNYHPRYSDLVVTGKAATAFKQPGFVVRSQAITLQTPKMVTRDWQRSVGAKNYLACERSVAKKRSNATQRFVSLRHIRIPPIGTHSALFRLIMDVTTTSGMMRVAYDVIAIGHGNAELTLVSVMPLASVPLLFPNELVMAKTMVRRVRL